MIAGKCSLLLLLASFALPYKVNPEWGGWVGCISHHEANYILQEWKNQPSPSLQCSLDLGLTQTIARLNDDGIHNTNNKLLATWDEISKIVETGKGCYALYDDGSKPWHISTLSETSSMPASLCPPLEQSGAPTLLLGGFTMHRIAGENINPMVDTTNKLSCIQAGPNSRILDTCMGLGYTAIGAAKKIKRRRLLGSKNASLATPTTGKVVTIEYDEASLEMSSYNPWSQGLFDGSLPIEVLNGDSCQIIPTFEESSFDCVIHDPPARALCTKDLYGLQFYSELYRVLRKPGGKLFHYIGNPKSKESGRLYGGIRSRLAEAGFKDVQLAEAAFGLTAHT